MRRVLSGIATLAVAGVLAACGKGVPSCGDVQATDMASQIVSNIIEKNIPGSILPAYRKAVHLTVEQPIVVTHDSKLDSFSCKAVAVYTIPDAVVAARQRSTSDPDYAAALNFKWRELMGMYAGEDVLDLAHTLVLADRGESEVADIGAVREGLRRAVQANAEADDSDLFIAADRFPAKARSEQLNELTQYTKSVLRAADATTHKVNLDIEYTIAKIDGQQNFKMEATFVDDDQGKGVRNLQVMESAALIENEALIAAKASENAPPTALQPETKVNAATVQPAEAASAIDEAAQPQPSSSAVARKASTVEAQSPETAVASQPIPASALIVQSAASSVPIVASFDCSKASTKVEKLICSSPQTADADHRLTAAYHASASKSADQATLKQQQREWLKERNACDDAACLLSVTEARIKVLSAM